MVVSERPSGRDLACVLTASHLRRFPRQEYLWGLHGRREERVRCHAEELVGVGLILPGLHGDPPVQRLHRIIGTVWRT